MASRNACVFLLCALCTFTANAQTDRDERYLRESTIMHIKGAGMSPVIAQQCGYPILAASWQTNAKSELLRQYGTIIKRVNISDAEIDSFMAEGRQTAARNWAEWSENERKTTCDNIRLMIRDDAQLR